MDSKIIKDLLVIDLTGMHVSIPSDASNDDVKRVFNKTQDIKSQLNNAKMQLIPSELDYNQFGDLIKQCKRHENLVKIRVEELETANVAKIKGMLLGIAEDFREYRLDLEKLQKLEKERVMQDCKVKIVATLMDVLPHLHNMLPNSVNDDYPEFIDEWSSYYFSMFKGVKFDDIQDQLVNILAEIVNHSLANKIGNYINGILLPQMDESNFLNLKIKLNIKYKDLLSFDIFEFIKEEHRRADAILHRQEEQRRADAIVNPIMTESDEPNYKQIIIGKLCYFSDQKIADVLNFKLNKDSEFIAFMNKKISEFVDFEIVAVVDKSVDKFVDNYSTKKAKIITGIKK